eukprot:GHVS01095148.1.p1 GENE.GHVS01095148.1~~GHVS01095148.1.p1  ORF type:complete len:735 (-),score=211.78 GHVS01095148.1:673-2877(-)
MTPPAGFTSFANFWDVFSPMKRSSIKTTTTTRQQPSTVNNSRTNNNSNNNSNNHDNNSNNDNNNNSNTKRKAVDSLSLPTNIVVKRRRRTGGVVSSPVSLSWSTPRGTALTSAGLATTSAAYNQCSSQTPPPTSKSKISATTTTATTTAATTTAATTTAATTTAATTTAATTTAATTTAGTTTAIICQANPPYRGVTHIGGYPQPVVVISSLKRRSTTTSSTTPSTATTTSTATTSTPTSTTTTTLSTAGTATRGTATSSRGRRAGRSRRIQRSSTPTQLPPSVRRRRLSPLPPPAVSPLRSTTSSRHGVGGAPAVVATGRTALRRRTGGGGRKPSGGKLDGLGTTVSKTEARPANSRQVRKHIMGRQQQSPPTAANQTTKPPPPVSSSRQAISAGSYYDSASSMGSCSRRLSLLVLSPSQRRHLDGLHTPRGSTNSSSPSSSSSGSNVRGARRRNMRPVASRRCSYQWPSDANLSSDESTTSNDDCSVVGDQGNDGGESGRVGESRMVMHVKRNRSGGGLGGLYRCVNLASDKLNGKQQYNKTSRRSPLKSQQTAPRHTVASNVLCSGRSGGVAAVGAQTVRVIAQHKKKLTRVHQLRVKDELSKRSTTNGGFDSKKKIAEKKQQHNRIVLTPINRRRGTTSDVLAAGVKTLKELDRNARRALRSDEWQCDCEEYLERRQMNSSKRIYGDVTGVISAGGVNNTPTAAIDNNDVTEEINYYQHPPSDDDDDDDH